MKYKKYLLKIPGDVQLRIQNLSSFTEEKEDITGFSYPAISEKYPNYPTHL